MTSEDLDIAFALMEKRRYDDLILNYVRRQTWGIAKKSNSKVLPCEIPLARLARLLGVGDQINHLTRARSELVKDGILTRSDDGFLVNKNLLGWSRSRLSLRALVVIALGEDGAERFFAGESVLPAKQLKIYRDSRRTRDLPATVGLPTSHGRNDLPATVGFAPAPDRNAREEDLEERQEDYSDRVADVVGLANSSVDPSPLDDRGRPLIRNAPAEVDRVAELADLAAPGHEMGRMVRQFCQPGPTGQATYHVVDLEYALVELSLKAQTEHVRKPWNYIRERLNRWMGETDGHPMYTFGQVAMLRRELTSTQSAPDEPGYLPRSPIWS